MGRAYSAWCQTPGLLSVSAVACAARQRRARATRQCQASPYYGVVSDIGSTTRLGVSYRLTCQ
ncbi:MAG: hypothetical protein LBK25_06975 [Treponema sp.]|nr:hypothetical protein [Treponema sp.]